ncbi:hypothetical protein FVE85_0197 [Porphyridium purpureum]|uniref:Uncharacterized protein n=1 Tax=Porphyridium purpureum TaxID=35688 RepID=A0A5J4YZF8_PORPP|nr:hypothetical protein FVE85_0197 [Porphyridium purpureum]|eukprot:POR0202..scf208_2
MELRLERSLNLLFWCPRSTAAVVGSFMRRAHARDSDFTYLILSLLFVLFGHRTALQKRVLAGHDREDMGHGTVQRGVMIVLDACRADAVLESAKNEFPALRELAARGSCGTVVLDDDARHAHHVIMRACADRDTPALQFVDSVASFELARARIDALEPNHFLVLSLQHFNEHASDGLVLADELVNHVLPLCASSGDMLCCFILRDASADVPACLLDRMRPPEPFSAIYQSWMYNGTERVPETQRSGFARGTVTWCHAYARVDRASDLTLAHAAKYGALGGIALQDALSEALFLTGLTPKYGA